LRGKTILVFPPFKSGERMLLRFKQAYLKLFYKKRYYKYKELLKNYQFYLEWVHSNRPSPPPHIVKQLLVRENASVNRISTLVETGTYLGEMVEAMSNYMTEIFSIELSVDLFNKSRIKFAQNKHITLLQGDSGNILPELLKRITTPCLFWLDGHYSGGITSKGSLETPIINELNAILSHKIQTHMILIDDARLFVGNNDYPTVNQLSQFIKEKDSALKLEIHDDAIFIFNKQMKIACSDSINFEYILRKELLNC